MLEGCFADTSVGGVRKEDVKMLEGGKEGVKMLEGGEGNVRRRCRVSWVNVLQNKVS